MQSSVSSFKILLKFPVFCKISPNVRCFAKTPGGIPSLGGKKGKLATGGGKAGPMLEKQILPVVEDPQRLVSYVCGTGIQKEGKDVKLKEDNEYPEWLWTLRMGKAPPLEELSPDTDAYWGRLRRELRRKNNRLAKLRRF